MLSMFNPGTNVRQDATPFNNAPLRYALASTPLRKTARGSSWWTRKVWGRVPS